MPFSLALADEKKVDRYNSAEVWQEGYDTIQEAITDAIAGDIIIVEAETYIEDLGPINTAGITLKSEDGAATTTIQLVDGIGIDLVAGADDFVLGGSEDHGFTILSGATTLFDIQLTHHTTGVEISYNIIDTTGSASMGISVGRVYG